MKLPLVIETEVTAGRLKIIDNGGYLTAGVCANSLCKTKSLGVKTDKAIEADFDAGPYIKKAKEYEKDLYAACHGEALGVEASVLAKEIAKYCSPQIKNAIKTEIKKGRDKETSNILIGF